MFPFRTTEAKTTNRGPVERDARPRPRGVPCPWGTRCRGRRCDGIHYRAEESHR